jgi:tetraacyldisaccharide 4'-kinase
MDQHRVDDILSGRKGGVGPALLRSLLLATSAPYSLMMRLRRGLYRRGLLPSHPAALPVISVGNITAGGTGKTPMVAWIVEQLKRRGARPAILTRGYKGSGGSSDEAELLRELTGRPVAVDADRVAGAVAAAADGETDVLVMDDGFQHRRLRRDMDIVLIDAMRPFGYGHCLPRGLLREPLSALSDADAIVITRSDTVEPDALRNLREGIARAAPRASLHSAVHRPVRIVSCTGGEIPLDALRGREVYAFCGIGNPASFFRLLEDIGARLTDRRIFDDHVAYTPQRVERLRSEARECDVLVTTQKDFVKLAGIELGGDLWGIEVEMEIVEGEAELVEKIVGAWKAAREAPGDES